MWNAGPTRLGATLGTSQGPLSGIEPKPDLAAILEAIGEVAYEWRLDTDRLIWSSNAGSILQLGDPQAIATGRAYARLFAPDTALTRFDVVTKSVLRDEGQGVPYQLQYALQVPSEPRLWVEDTGRWFAGGNGRPLRAHGVLRVVTERHAREERLNYLSRFDDLTGEMNRQQLTEFLAETLDEAVRNRTSAALFLVAIDNVAAINDAYGFAIADEVITAVARRLRTRLRRVDALGRLSGNKFGVMLKNCSAEEVSVAAQRLLASVREDVVMTSGGPVAATITIGGVLVPRYGRDAAEAMHRAQETLEQARAKRLGSFLCYRPNLERDALRAENFRASRDIVAALEAGRIVLAFEPVVDARTRLPQFYECLVRMRRADETVVSADIIIPVAERLGLVRLLDRRVLDLAINELGEHPGLRLSINISPASTVDPDWWGNLVERLRGRPQVAQRLTLEITEMAEIRDPDETRGFVSRVKDLGCRLAIDDFGAGFTSFRNLRKLAVDTIKIDGSFVRKITRSEDDRAFVRSLAVLGGDLGLETVAEWVQDEASAAMLAEWGCTYLQGSLIGLGSLERPWAAGCSPKSQESAEALSPSSRPRSDGRGASASRRAGA